MERIFHNLKLPSEEGEPSASVTAPSPLRHLVPRPTSHSVPGQIRADDFNDIPALQQRLSLQAAEEEQMRMAMLMSLATKEQRALSVVREYFHSNRLDYTTTVVDGFYDVSHSNSKELQSLTYLLKQPLGETEVIAIDRTEDAVLRDMQERARMCLAPINNLSDRLKKLAILVSDFLGGSENRNVVADSVRDLQSTKHILGTNVIPIGELKNGVCRHRAILFKTLADAIQLPTKLVRTRQGSEMHCTNIANIFGVEYCVDVMFAPGTFYRADTPEGEEQCRVYHDNETNGVLPSDASMTREERALSLSDDFPAAVTSRHRRSISMPEKHLKNFLEQKSGSDPSLAGQHFGGGHGLLKGVVEEDGDGDSFNVAAPEKQEGATLSTTRHDAKLQRANSSPIAATRSGSSNLNNPMLDDALDAFLGFELPQFGDHHELFVENQGDGGWEGGDLSGFDDSEVEAGDEQGTLTASLATCRTDLTVTDVASSFCDRGDNDPTFDHSAEKASDWEISSLDQLALAQRIGIGSFGEVFCAEWQGTEVAVKRLLEQELNDKLLSEFRQEVALFSVLRHPNVVLFMGACTTPPDLSIVTEYMPRGSLYRVLHKSTHRVDLKRALRMALDAALGINYLHTRNPVIVHRDIKSANFLVSKDWTVKVCDFGLSKVKHLTFLSTTNFAGTPNWTAPEVLRNEPNNEKADVFSFGVILWELFTRQIPFADMNPMQVVGAVGFQGKTLAIPDNVAPEHAKLIQDCCAPVADKRPAFAEVVRRLRVLIVEEGARE